MPRPRINAEAEGERILAAAESILKRTRKPALSVQDVADECGMSPSNVYRFFRNKDDLVRSLVARWFKDIETALDSIVEEKRDPEHAVRAFISTQHSLKCARHDADPTLFRTYLAFGDQHRDAVREHVVRLKRQFDLLLVRFLAAEGMSTDLGETYARMLEDMTVAYRVPQMIAMDREARTPERLERILDYAILAIRAKPEMGKV